MYQQVLSTQLYKDLVLILFSAGIAAWGYWLPLPGLVRAKGAVIRAFGRILMVLMVVAIVVLASDVYYSYQDLQLDGPERLVGEIASKDTSPLPFRRKGVIVLDGSSLRFTLDLERLENLRVGDRVEIEYARHTRTVLRVEKVS